MRELFPYLLFFHLVGVIVGLGPTFMFSWIAGSGAREPAHARYSTRLIQAISTSWSKPLSVLVLLTGAGMIWSLGYDVLATGWLLLSIILFFTSFLYAALVQNRDLVRILLLSEDGPPDPASLEGMELRRRRQRVRRASVFMRISTLVILFMMVVKPF